MIRFFTLILGLAIGGCAASDTPAQLIRPLSGRLTQHITATLTSTAQRIQQLPVASVANTAFDIAIEGGVRGGLALHDTIKWSQQHKAAALMLALAVRELYVFTKGFCQHGLQQGLRPALAAGWQQTISHKISKLCLVIVYVTEVIGFRLGKQTKEILLTSLKSAACNIGLLRR